VRDARSFWRLYITMPLFAPASKEPVDNPREAAQQVRIAYANDEDDMPMSDAAVAKKWQGTEVDRKDMSVLGRVQELRVELRIPGHAWTICC
jgi:hypothetical protein